MGSLRRILLVLLFFFALSGILCAADDFCFFGVFPGWGEFEDDVSTDALVNFERLVGKRVAVVPFSVFFGQGASKVPGNLEAIASYGAVPLVRLMPWGPPYWVPEYQERYSLLRIARGEHDALLREVAEAVRDFGELTVVTFGVEMNGDWFPWSGVFQGGAQEGPENFRRAFRHVVEVFREAGAANVLWLFQVNHESHPDEPWNAPANYYPGDDYVDIVGFSLYGKQFVDEPWMSFGELMERAYPVVSRIAPEKPLILAEWGVGEWPDGDKAAWYEEALALFKDRYPLIRAAIVYHDRWENADGTYSDLRVDSSPESLEAFREGIKWPYFEGFPCGLSLWAGSLAVSATVEGREVEIEVAKSGDAPWCGEWWIVAETLFGRYVFGPEGWTATTEPVFQGCVRAFRGSIFDAALIPGTYAVKLVYDPRSDRILNGPLTCTCTHFTISPFGE